MWMNLLASIDYIAVLFAAIAGMVLGAVWYLPGVFGTAWRGALGNERWNHPDPRQAVVVRAIATGITAFSLAVLVAGAGVTTLAGSLRLGLVVGLGIVAPTIIADYHFSGRRWTLTGLTAAHRIVHIVLMSCVLGAFNQFT